MPIDPQATDDFITKYPTIQDLKRKAKKRIPRFAFEYLEGGCNEDVNLYRNKSDIQEVELMPRYLNDYEHLNTSAEIFGEIYSSPFGISPIGLQGMMWPNAPEILAKAAVRHNVPFILSTVSTSSIERIAEITEGRSWFQVYHPAREEIRNDILDRVKASGMNTLVLLTDVPVFGYRPRDIRNGLALPPNMSLRNILQIFGKPNWAMKTLYHGQPQFASLKKYMPKSMNLRELGNFMNTMFDGRLTEDKIASIRDRWRGNLVVKGIVNEEDAEKCLRLGVDGIIVSNHGGRQLDAGQSTIKPLQHLAGIYGDKMTVMVDGGVRSGPDIARMIACGAKFVFAGRPFMYGAGALGNRGGNHTIAMLKMQFEQVMGQLCCEAVGDLPQHLVKKTS